jgi:deoxycytidylate deaminase
MRGSVVVAFGFNQRERTHPKAEGYLRTLHAEHHALIGVDAAGADVYVYRAVKAGAPAEARPCPNCWRLLLKAGVRRVYYTTPKGVAWEALDKPGRVCYIDDVLGIPPR